MWKRKMTLLLIYDTAHWQVLFHWAKDVAFTLSWRASLLRRLQQAPFVLLYLWHSTVRLNYQHSALMYIILDPFERRASNG